MSDVCAYNIHTNVQLTTVVGASLSKPHHMRSTVKSVFLIASLMCHTCMAESNLSANRNYIKRVNGALSVNLKMHAV